MTIRTRFAPSPTGYLHIGGVRTALFNWLLTQRQGGRFLLRIDDTDVGRNRPEALQPILDGFRWLGINWDEGPEAGGSYGPYFQSQRGPLYLEAALRLLDGGHAYPAYETAEELKAAREAAKGGSIVFRGPHRNTPPAECRRLWEEKPTVLRLKVPEGRILAMDDLIRGRVEWQTDLIGDPVILRADGSPLYNFATVVDEATMQITHVIRAVEHLTNTAVQILVYEGLGCPVPQFAHVPVVNAPNSSEKLSKRKMQKFMTPEVIAKLRAVHGVPPETSDAEVKTREDLNPATVAYYQALGYLPAALVNYLGRLGWSMDASSEKIPLDVMIANFSLDRVNNAPGSFDPEKLLWLAGEYMKDLPIAEKVNGVLPFLTRAGLIQEPVTEAVRHKVRQIVEATGDRLSIFADIVLHAPPFLKKDPDYDPRAIEKKLKKGDTATLLANFRDVLADAPPFDPASLEQLLTSYCEQHGAKKNVLVHALRVAVTGSEVGLGLYETLVILGREETLRRINLGLQLAEAK